MQDQEGKGHNIGYERLLTKRSTVDLIYQLSLLFDMDSVLPSQGFAKAA